MRCHPAFSNTQMDCLAGKGQRGFSLVSAIFLLVVLAGLGVAMVSISTVHHTSSAFDVQGIRAYQAARAGVEWGLFQRIQNNACASAASTTSFALTAPTLSSFTVTVQCVPTSGPTAAQSRWTITSTACNQPAAGTGSCPNTNPANREEYVQRVIEVDL